MTQHFTDEDFKNMTQIRIEGQEFGDRLTNSINFVADFFQFGIKKGVESVQEIVDFVSPSQRADSAMDPDPRRRVTNPADDPVFITDNPQD